MGATSELDTEAGTVVVGGAVPAPAPATGPRPARWVLGVAAAVLAVLAVGIGVVPEDGPIRRLVAGPEERQPDVAPPVEQGADLITVRPDPDGGIRRGERFEVTVADGGVPIDNDDEGLEVRWERWDGDGWEPTHVLTSTAGTADANGISEGSPPAEPLVVPYEETGGFDSLAAIGYEARLPFRAPDVGPGIYRICLSILSADPGSGVACSQIRFPGPGLPELRQGPATTDEAAGLPLVLPWALAEDPSVVAGATEVVVLADQGDCTSVDPASAVATVATTADAVTVTVHGDVLGGGVGSCSDAPVRLVVPLGTQLRERKLVDGGCGDPAATVDCPAGTVRWPLPAD